MSSPRPPSRPKASEEGLAIQQEVDSKEAKKPSSPPRHSAMQAGIRDYPTEFVAQHHAKPGEERQIRPAPMYDAPGYKGSDTLLMSRLSRVAIAESAAPWQCFMPGKARMSLLCI